MAQHTNDDDNDDDFNSRHSDNHNEYPQACPCPCTPTHTRTHTRTHAHNMQAVPMTRKDTGKAYLNYEQCSSKLPFHATVCQPDGAGSSSL